MGGGYMLPEQKLIIFWANKSGCSTIYELVRSYILKKNFSRFDPKYFIKDYDPSNPEQVCCNKVIVLRNPFTRILSCFLNKFVIYGSKFLYSREDLEPDIKPIFDKIKNKRLRKNGGTDTIEGITFEDFVDWVIEFGHENPHSTKQIYGNIEKHIENGNGNGTGEIKVVQLEKFEKELTKCIPCLDSIKFPVINKTDYRTEHVGFNQTNNLQKIDCFNLDEYNCFDLDKYLSNDIITKLRKYYFNDFKYGKYSHKFTKNIFAK